MIKKHTPATLIISTILFVTDAIVEIFADTGTFAELTNMIICIIPVPIGKFIHIIFDILAMPLGLCTGIYDFYFYAG